MPCPATVQPELVALLLGSLWGRAASVPEMQLRLQTQPADTGRVRLLNGLCYTLHDNQPTLALRYGEQAVTLARELPDRPGLMRGLQDTRTPLVVATGVVTSTGTTRT